ncbi:MAG: ABC transporter permease [Lachnospiraceae bacterium]|nr:ABC transporter permease [Lachnospiraceae bacterium]MDY3276110.1 ABC transporter permease [Agathobacter sp.]
MHKEPLIRVAKRDGMPLYQNILIRAVAIVLAMLLVVLFVHFTAGISAGTTISYMWEGVFGNSIYLRDTVFYTAKLLCIAVALAPAFKMRFWNCGAEGQVLAGGLATAVVMVYCGNLPAPLLYLVMFISALALAAIWGILPAVFKAKMGVNETLFTLMMNYVAIKLVDFFYNKWKGSASSLGKLNKGTKAGYLPDLFGSENSWLLLAVVILTIAVYFYLSKTKHGYEIAVVGESQRTAEYAGINVKTVTIRTMMISGIICGICGFMTVAGHDHSISSSTTAGGYGFTAIIVAWLAKFNTGFMVLISLFVIFLERGTSHIADKCSGFDASASKIVIGLVLFFVIGSEFFINYKINLRSKHDKEVA